MKIGILTYWQSLDNYGQILQAYAFQQVLKRMGHEPYIIRYDFENRGYPISFFKKVARILLFPIYLKRKKCKQIIKEEKRKRDVIRLFDEFRKKYFIFSSKLYLSLRELQNNPPTADCYIVGSDQVWGQLLFNPENNTFFLDFGEKETKRIAYAASFGRSEYPVKLKSKLHQCLMHLDYVSCREYDGIQICKNVGIHAEKTLDPTLIADMSIYKRLITQCSTKGNYIFIYSINIQQPDEIRWSELSLLSREYDFKTIVTMGSGYCEGREIYEGVTYSYATIEQWLTNIANAKMVVTTSFHGVVFSILLHRLFTYIPLERNFSKGNNRVFDLLNDLGLSDRVLSKKTSYQRLFVLPIDWNNVDLLLDKQRSTSLSFLFNALK